MMKKKRLWLKGKIGKHEREMRKLKRHQRIKDVETCPRNQRAAGDICSGPLVSSLTRQNAASEHEDTGPVSLSHQEDKDPWSTALFWAWLHPDIRLDFTQPDSLVVTSVADLTQRLCCVCVRHEPASVSSSGPVGQGWFLSLCSFSVFC